MEQKNNQPMETGLHPFNIVLKTIDTTVTDNDINQVLGNFINSCSLQLNNNCQFTNYFAKCCETFIAESDCTTSNGTISENVNIIPLKKTDFNLKEIENCTLKEKEIESTINEDDSIVSKENDNVDTERTKVQKCVTRRQKRNRNIRISKKPKVQKYLNFLMYFHKKMHTVTCNKKTKIIKSEITKRVRKFITTKLITPKGKKINKVNKKKRVGKPAYKKDNTSTIPKYYTPDMKPINYTGLPHLFEHNYGLPSK